MQIIVPKMVMKFNTSTVMSLISQELCNRQQKKTHTRPKLKLLFFYCSTKQKIHIFFRANNEEKKEIYTYVTSFLPKLEQFQQLQATQQTNFFYYVDCRNFTYFLSSFSIHSYVKWCVVRSFYVLINITQCYRKTKTRTRAGMTN